MKFICFFVLVLAVKFAKAQIQHNAVSGTYINVGTYSSHFKDAFSFAGNQAALSGSKEAAAGIYSERKFSLKEVKQFSAAVSFPCLSGATGLTLDYDGMGSYNQFHAGLAYGRPLGNCIDLGVQFNYNRISIAGYGNTSLVTFEVGTIFHLTDKLYLGCHIYNPAGGKSGDSNSEKLMSVYSLGTGYEASEKLFLSLEIVKPEKQSVNVNIALQYIFIKQFFIRGGMACTTGSYFAGTSFYWKNLRTDIAANWHPQAGLTPSLGFIFGLSKIERAQE